MSSNSNIPLHEPVGTDTNNWTTLSKEEAKIRAKAVQKGHEPHDWRWAYNKTFKTDKAYPESLRPVVNSSGNVPAGDEQPNTSDFVRHTTDTPLGPDRLEHQQEARNFGNFHETTAPRSNVNDAPLGSNLLGHQQRDEHISAPENAPEFAGGRDRASEPKTQTNIVG
ncbi:hypothetical protein M408DRAFT_20072 [Serendipita vermifera MAFF 305830]|uniref:Uncharacterized protein n=1 Tax=Serendipita vermifera MAFF 305830 TaxID=933852 RepID=A0A0C3BKX8_SERVB|nr:hypothetical protein M408DRAFT_20072 [Serendipita vermifera MAFF 305830]